MSDTIYYKVLKRDGVQKGFRYQWGIVNVLDKPFQVEGSCVPGGLYFTTLEYIDDFFSYGDDIVEVFFPDDASFCMVEDPAKNKWRANKIILGEKYSLDDPETFVKLGIISKIPLMLVREKISELGIIFLHWLERNGYHFNKYSMEYIMDDAICNGYLSVLKWFRETRPVFSFYMDSLNYALINGHRDVLEWFMTEGYQIKFARHAINTIVAKKDTEMILWLEKISSTEISLVTKLKNAGYIQSML